jgi:hypothetical protein
MLGSGPGEEFSCCFTTLRTHQSCLLHKSELSSDIVVFDVAFLVICYVYQLPRYATC